MSAATATITSGNSSRMPKTAMMMPTPRNSFCQNASQVFNTEALTTALSNDSDASMMLKMSAMPSADMALVKPPFSQPHYAATARQTKETRNDILKCFIPNSFVIDQ